MKLGFLGAGNMSTALVKGALSAGFISPENLYVSDISEIRVKAMRELGVNAQSDNAALVRACDYVVCAVKPNVLPHVLSSLKEELRQKVLVSIAAGVSIKTMKKILGENTKIVRIMPNVPALVGEGMSVVCRDNMASDEDIAVVMQIFGAVGKAVELPERLINISTATNGSGPAYVFMMIEAMADAAVLHGMPRDVAYLLVSQTILGAAKLALDTGEHPGRLKDMVCSPGGTAIEAVYQLETDSFRASLINAIDSCYKKAERLSCE
ncbi:MAG: pyrroline-5-carboxylate reductase [Clostridia bacterium]|nr:pyrroline-5-carboxylate reductase [Clostridia bacterium]